MIVFAGLEALPASLPCSDARKKELDKLKNGDVVLEKRGAEALLWLCYARRFPNARRPFDYPRTSLGKPFFPDAGAFHFSLSHTAGFALCAALSSPCGADIERIGRISERVTARFFHEKERAYLASLPEKERAEAAARVWCLREADGYKRLLDVVREAYGKRLGTGLFGLGKEFYVLPSGETSAQGVHLRSFLLTPSLAAAVCATEEIRDIPEEIRW